jgi:hypothetical protein
LAGAKNKEPFPKAAVLETNVAAWPNEIEDVVTADLGKQALEKIKDKVRSTYDFNENMDKNPLFIGYVMAEAWDQGLKSTTLEKLCRELLKLGESAVAKPACSEGVSAT